MPDSQKPPEAELHINSQIYTGWQRVSVTRSIEQLAGTFDLTLTDKWALEDQALQLACGQKASVVIAGETVLTGYIDQVAPQIDAKSHSISVHGRDAAGDLVDCSALDASQEIDGRDLLQVAQSLCAPFGIAVRSETDMGAAFDTTHFQIGETVYEVLDRLARMRGVLCVSDGQGGLVLTRAGSRRASTQIRDNVLQGSATRDQRDRFHLYRVLGQQRGSDFIQATEAAQSSADVTDTGITRYRPLIVMAEDQASAADCIARGQWERSVRAGRANTAQVTVRGWFDGGELWAPNMLIEADCRALGLSGEYLISNVTYSVDYNGGQVTALSIAPPDAFAPMPSVAADPAGESALFEEAS